jgi:hypothetical protein
VTTRTSARVALAWLALGATGCSQDRVPAPDRALREYAEAARKGDARALHDMMTERSQRSLGREGVERAVRDGKGELASQGDALLSGPHKLEATARVRFDDGEQATLELEDGAFRVSAADALPAAARTPAQALEQLRNVLARRSYAGLMRVLSKETRSAVERDLRSLVEGLERPESLDIKVHGDDATVNVGGGHLVRLHREGSTWQVEDFD